MQVAGEQGCVFVSVAFCRLGFVDCKCHEVLSKRVLDCEDWD